MDLSFAFVKISNNLVKASWFKEVILQKEMEQADCMLDL